MKIISFSFSIINLPLIKPFKTALRTVNTLESILVKITTDEGFIGYGETAPTKAITGDTKESIIESIKTIVSKLADVDINKEEDSLNIIHSAIEKNTNAKASIEIALYDIWSQKANLPLYEFLGGEKTNFKTAITISLNDIPTMVKDSLEAIKNGFTSLKIKLGDNYLDDIKRVKQISQAIDNSISIKLDANQGWTPEESVSFLQALESNSIPIELIEQPVHKDDIKGLQHIKKNTTIPILADESVFSPKDAIDIINAKAVDFINIKLDKCGGISKALEIADICHTNGIQCMVGCMMEGAISVGAAAHFASAKSDIITMYDLDAPMLCASSPIIGGANFNAPNIALNDSKGLGIISITNANWTEIICL